MLSDEEKKAIEYWKTHMEILHWNAQLASEHYIKVLLDLIKKQSKEIEELNKSDESKEQSSMNYYNLYRELVDKIKAILEEYKYTEIGDSEKIIEFYKKIQSLLEKE